MQHLVLRGGIGLETYWIAWMDVVIAELTAARRPTDLAGP
ncbi:hypothetical protein [Streptomyces sp. NPDC001070]